MVRIIEAAEQTNSFKPEAWRMTEEPFPAFRAQGQNVRGHNLRGFLPVAADFEVVMAKTERGAFSSQPSKVIKTKKGGWLLVPASPAGDERIMLITAKGGFRGGFADDLKVIDGELLWSDWSGAHCAPIMFAIVRFYTDNGYAWLETGRRSCRGAIEIFSWDGSYRELPTEEFEAAEEAGALEAMVACKSDRLDADIKKGQQEVTDYKASLACRDKVVETLEEAKVEYYDLSFGRATMTYKKPGIWNSPKEVYYSLETAAQIIEAEARYAKKAAMEDALDEMRKTFMPAFQEAYPSIAPVSADMEWLKFLRWERTTEAGEKYLVDEVEVSVPYAYPYGLTREGVTVPPLYKGQDKFTWSLDEAGLKQFKEDIAAIEQRTVTVKNLKEELEARQAAEEKAKQDRIDHLKKLVDEAAPELSENIKAMFIFDKSEATDEQVLDNIKCIYTARDAVKTDEEIHELSCGLKRRVDAIQAQMAKAGKFTPEAMVWYDQTMTTELAVLITNWDW